MRLKRYIKEATYRHDKFFRDISKKAWVKFKKVLDKKYKEWEKTGRVDLPEHKGSGGYIVYGHEFGYPQLIIILAVDKIGNPGYSTNAGKDYKGKPLKAIVLPTLLSPMDFKFANTRVNKASWEHEFIHFLDDLRGDDYQNTAKLRDDKGDAAYYNTAGEFNAYFQEGASEVEDLLKHVWKVKPDKVIEILSSMEVFKNWMLVKTNFFNKNWHTSLDLKWKRKFLKRLATFYKGLVKEYEKPNKVS